MTGQVSNGAGQVEPRSVNDPGHPAHAGSGAQTRHPTLLPLLEGLRQVLDREEAAMAGLLAQAEAGRVPDRAGLDAARSSIGQRAAAFEKAATLFSDEVEAVAAAMRARRKDIETRDLLTPYERFLTSLSKESGFRRRRRRWEGSRCRENLFGLLRRADQLLSLLSDERRLRRDSRARIETHLDRFAALPVAGRASPDTLPLPITVLNGFADGLTGEIVTLDTISHRLVLDTEEILVLIRAVAEIDGLSPNPAQNPAQDLPEEITALSEIAPQVERYRQERLVILDRSPRRSIVENAFRERFPPPPAPEGWRERTAAVFRTAAARLGIASAGSPRAGTARRPVPPTI